MRRGLLVWLTIMAVETVHGVLRGLYLVPHVGEHMAELIGWPIGLAIVLLTSWLTIRWTGLKSTRALLGLGLIWALLTLAFEMVIGLARGLDAAELWAAANPLQGGLLVYSLLVMLLAPWCAARVRGV